MRCLTRVARACEEAGQPERGADCLQRLIDADPLYELPYRQLMLALQRAGDLTEARSTYERLRAALSAKLKTMPSAETQEVYASLGAKAPR
jgi:two-component SAPR family response regulator